MSTTEQGISGLGLDAQRLTVSAYLAMVADGQCIAELTEIESGKRKDRAQLAEAMKIARRRKATLVIARLDRLARTMNDHSVSTMRGVRWCRPALYRLIQRYQRPGVAV